MVSLWGPQHFHPANRHHDTTHATSSQAIAHTWIIHMKPLFSCRSRQAPAWANSPLQALTCFALSQLRSRQTNPIQLNTTVPCGHHSYYIFLIQFTIKRPKSNHRMEKLISIGIFYRSSTNLYRKEGDQVNTSSWGFLYWATQKIIGNFLINFFSQSPLRQSLKAAEICAIFLEQKINDGNVKKSWIQLESTNLL